MARKARHLCTVLISTNRPIITETGTHGEGTHAETKVADRFAPGPGRPAQRITVLHARRCDGGVIDGYIYSRESRASCVQFVHADAGIWLALVSLHATLAGEFRCNP